MVKAQMNILSKFVQASDKNESPKEIKRRILTNNDTKKLNALSDLADNEIEDAILLQQSRAQLLELGQQNGVLSEETLLLEFDMAKALCDGGKLSESREILNELLPKIKEMGDRDCVISSLE